MINGVNILNVVSRDSSNGVCFAVTDENGKLYSVPDDMGNKDRVAISEWEAIDGNSITHYQE